MTNDSIRKPIPGYEGLYEVGVDGTVWNCKGKKMKNVLHPTGYYVVTLTKDGKGKKCKVHRIVATTFIPNPQNKSQVNHIDGNKLNNFVENLEWVTPSENIRHAMDSGLLTFNRQQIDGKRFGRLVAIGCVGVVESGKNKHRELWKCLCDCGRTTIVRDNNLITGQVRSCGCLKGRPPKEKRKTLCLDKENLSVKAYDADFIFRNIGDGKTTGGEDISDREVVEALCKTVEADDYSSFSRLEMMNVIKWLLKYVNKQCGEIG